MLLLDCILYLAGQRINILAPDHPHLPQHTAIQSAPPSTYLTRESTSRNRQREALPPRTATLAPGYSGLQVLARPLTIRILVQINAPKPAAVPVYAVCRAAEGMALKAAGVVLLLGVENGSDVAVVGGEGADCPIGSGDERE